MTRQLEARWRAWLWAALSVSAALVAAVALWLDLSPKVEQDFFFSPQSESLREARRIEALFDLRGQLVVIARAPDIGAPAYTRRIAALTEALLDVPAVVEVKSLTRGPDGLEDARDSPLWRRLLLPGDGSGTYLVAILSGSGETVVQRIEAVVEAHQHPDFDLLLAGVPFTVVVMQRELVRDFAVFGASAIVVFGLVSLALFRSPRIALGNLACCLSAVAATLLALRLSGAGLGLLTANLVTIVFVLAQSHVIFLTSNWQHLAREMPGEEAARRAWRETLRPSLASMVTTGLGFGTLLFVDAKPLRELGLGGVIGAALACAVVYALLPPFLAVARAASGPDTGGAPDLVARWLDRPTRGPAVGVAAACALLGLGLVCLDTDPSLLRYFDADGDVHHGLAHLDRHGGSSPLELVVSRPDGASLLEDGGERLWELQRALEERPDVGRVLSLPVVVAEAERFPFAGLLSRSLLVGILETPLLDRVARSFLSEDRTQALLLLQMAEHERETHRLEVVKRIEGVVRGAGLSVDLVGGIFQLQGRLSAQVASSLRTSLAILPLLFAAVAWWAVGSLRVVLVMTVTLALVPLGVFGGMGWLGAPLDVVVAPAVSVGLGLAADALLHLGVATRRASGASGRLDADAWRRGRRAQWPGILRASAIVAAGFALFALSSFPPTRRFGLAVGASTLLAAPLALFVLPRLARAPLLERGGRPGASR